jgi:hypothetical protein
MSTKRCIIYFHKTFVNSDEARFVRAIKRDFGLECKETKHSDGIISWEILGNRVVKELTVGDIFELDKKYGILEFEQPNTICLR